MFETTYKLKRRRRRKCVALTSPRGEIHRCPSWAVPGSPYCLRHSSPTRDASIEFESFREFADVGENA